VVEWLVKPLIASGSRHERCIAFLHRVSLDLSRQHSFLFLTCRSKAGLGVMSVDWTGVDGQGYSRVVRKDGSQDTVNRARITLGKWSCRELQRKTQGRTAGPGDYLHIAGGIGTVRDVVADLCSHQAIQLAGLQTAGATVRAGCKHGSYPGEVNTTSSTKTGGG